MLATRLTHVGCTAVTLTLALYLDLDPEQRSLYWHRTAVSLFVKLRSTAAERSVLRLPLQRPNDVHSSHKGLFTRHKLNGTGLMNDGCSLQGGSK